MGRFVGLDVHAETIAVALAEANGGEVGNLGIIPNRESSLKKLLGKLALKGWPVTKLDLPGMHVVATDEAGLFLRCGRPDTHTDEAR